MDINKPAETVKPADEKARLECEKMRAEIEVMRKPFYKASSFYTAFAPIVLAALGLYVTWKSGWFDVQRTRINNEKLLVQVQTERLQNERSNLQSETQMQRQRILTTEQEIQSMRFEKGMLTNQIAQLERERDEIRSAASYFQKQAERLAGAETNSLRMLYDLQSVQAERKAASLEIANLQKTNAALITQLKYVRDEHKRIMDFFIDNSVKKGDDAAVNFLLKDIRHKEAIYEALQPQTNVPPSKRSP